VKTFWKIERMTRNIEDGGVLVAHWRLIVDDGEYQTTAVGYAGFSPDSTDEKFIKYEHLTEDEVNHWVMNSLGEEKINQVINTLVAEIEKIKATTTSEGLPWDAPKGD
jgi:hypothetical protein